MLRGFIGGIFWGTLLSVGGLAALSVHDSMRKRPAPVPVSVAVPAGSEFNSKREDRQANLAPRDTRPLAPMAAPSALPLATDDTQTYDPVLDAARDTATQPTTQDMPSALPSAPQDEERPPQIAITPPDKPNLSLENIKRPEKPLKQDVALAPQAPVQPNIANTEEAPLPTAPAVPNDPIDTPTLGASEEQEIETEAMAETPKFVDDPDMPAYQEYGAADIPVDGKPMLSIILVEDAQRALRPETLEGLAFPVSIAIDPAGPDVFEHGVTYLSAGFDVIAHGGFVTTPSAQDIATGIEGISQDMPYVIGFLEETTGAFQGNRGVLKQLTQSSVALGQGLIVHNKGLNPILGVAEKTGVPALVITADIDGAGQNISAIRRQLDGAAFKARQKGSAVVIGRLQPDTVTALLQWALQSRAQTVAIVPVSQQMRQMMKN